MVEKHFRHEPKRAKDDDALSLETRQIEKLREHLIRAEQSGFFEPDAEVILAEFKSAARNAGRL